ncbi:MAG: hypothetical protein ACD_72C00261G0012 [uncultured bacterium]|nr:MAG: hypothetical protein ACD_72C00261G0012 [uncultured bacterium]
MKNLALKKIKRIGYYEPPFVGRRNFDGLLLDFNERTIKTDPAILRTIKKYLDSGDLQTYPEYRGLNERIAKYAGVSVENIMTVNGTDQGIDLIFRTFTDKDEVIIPQPSFAMFFQWSNITGNKIISPVYDEKTMAFPFKNVLNSINKRTKLIVICNPNNPTGTLLSVKQISTIAKRAKNAIVYVDEAYFEFSKISAVGLLRQYSNIIISRTFSKAFGLGGLRIGYLIARPEYIREMSKVRGPYDVNMVAYLGAMAALENLSVTKLYVNEIINQSRPLVEKFFRENNIKYFSSASNFVLIRPDNSKKVFGILKQNGVLVRLLNQQSSAGMIRVTVGTVSQMKIFINVYTDKILTQKYAFIDRDGTIIFEPQDTFQIDSPAQLKILPGVVTGLQKLMCAGYKLIMLSNQDGLGTKSYPKRNFDIVQNKLINILKQSGIVFEKVFVCPHFERDECLCRKPKLGLVKSFLEKQKIDLKNSFVVGDRKSDRDFSRNINACFVPMKTNGNFIKSVNDKLYEKKKSKIQ